MTKLRFASPPIRLVVALAAAVMITLGAAAAQAEPEGGVRRYPYDPSRLTVVGKPQWHKVKAGETMLDIARNYGLGYNDVTLVYPNMDPWLPPTKRSVMVPSLFVLPPTQLSQLVINIPELRIYFFDAKSRTVQTYPIGIGDEGWETPLGVGFIREKREHPTWYIPASLQAKYQAATMPPGPDNPLGDYFMGLSLGAYGIHGTAMPWGVGRLVSHGCIRCYPEHILLLYPQVAIGTKLEIIYQPVKIGRIDEQIFVEAHPDVYQRVGDYTAYGLDKLQASGLGDLVDRDRLLLALRLQNGVPTNVSRISNRSGPGYPLAGLDQ